MNLTDKLDETDRGILKLLEKDGRISHKAIAYELHKTVTPIHARIRRLQQAGYIKRFTALVDAKKVDRGLTAYTQVLLKTHSSESLKNFMREAVKVSEIMECYHMTGTFDFLLRIAIRDMEEYNIVLVEKLSNLPEVANLQSFFVISEAKSNTGFFFNQP
ncbi:Lrp/AsnC family leucine-responsive transcriptional regulator [Mucilaginibacter sp. UYP25]|uniref:Lrp/AsnC family transcriptional regulator n=1 Tax=unclassified Mucilaginibacter TaxID=2617802 RepID=UPI0033977ACA